MSHQGSCICGAVRFTVDGPLTTPVVCHCIQCRKGSGHVVAATNAERAKLRLSGEVRWYDYKPGIGHGFCPICGAQLFWSAHEHPLIGIHMGAFDGETGLSIGGHVFAAEKGDYYDLNDGLPVLQGNGNFKDFSSEEGA